MNKKNIKAKVAKYQDKSKQGLQKIHQNKFLNEFKEFISRGSVMDMAVGIIIGGAFTAIITSLVNDILMPLIGLVAGGVDFTNLAITIPNFFGTDNQAVIRYGNFIQCVVNFLIIAFCIFLCIKLINRFHRKEEKEAEEEEKAEVALLKEIRDELKKKK